ncbi:MAG: hypothetical protein ACI865_002810 [Flavobacteriaceae bacterium]|jgi:hypothetical protein
MKPIYTIIILSILTLLSSCHNSVRDDSVGSEDNNIHHDTEEILVEKEEEIDLGSINEENKALFDALIPLNDNSLPKEMNLSEDGFKLLPLSYLGKEFGLEHTIYAEYSYQSNDDVDVDRALILRVESSKTDEAEVFQSETHYFLIVFDEFWEVSDRKKIHAKNSSLAGKLVSSGWHEISRRDSDKNSTIEIGWMKILLERGKVVIVDEDATTFDGSEDGSSEAKQFQNGIHSKEWR